MLETLAQIIYTCNREAHIKEASTENLASICHQLGDLTNVPVLTPITDSH